MFRTNRQPGLDSIGCAQKKPADSQHVISP
jgi:hypothetical protein